MNFFLPTFQKLNSIEENKTIDNDDNPIRTESSEVKSARMQVFLKIRPENPPVKNEEDNNIYLIQDSSTLLVKQFNENIPRKKFIFSRIFDQQTDEEQFFNDTIKPNVIDFLNNQSSTVISYGAADSGKTYTLFGSTTHSGIIPRSIEFIYSSLNCTPILWYKPTRFRSIVNLNDCDRVLEIESKDKLLSCLIDKSLYEEAYKKLKNADYHKIHEPSNDYVYSIWISFVEIYNDTIYDLLEVDEDGKKTELKLATDKRGDTYIHEMRSVCATTDLEAYEILNAGQMRLSTHPLSNYKSSRSHSIFIIKLIKYDKNLSSPQVEICSMSFCDLAGSGRTQKSVDSAKYLKESRSINISLLALGRCLKIITAEKSKQNGAPFRDSKLTRIIQRALCGKENFVLLININPSSELHVETLNVLNFATMAMKLVYDSLKEDKKIIDCQSVIVNSKPRGNSSSTSIKSIQGMEIDEIISKYKQLKVELKQLKAYSSNKETEIRQEMMEFYTKQLSDLEEKWKIEISEIERKKNNILEQTVSQIKNYYKRLLVQYSEDTRGDLKELPDKHRLKKKRRYNSTKNLFLKKPHDKLLNKNKQLNMQKNRLTQELSLLKKYLKYFVEFINIPNKLLDTECELKKLIADDGNNKSVLHKEVSYNLSIIEKFITRRHKTDEGVEKLRKTKIKSTKSVQCDLELSIIKIFWDDVRRISNLNSISILNFDDSFVYELSANPFDGLSLLLSKIKELLLENTSNTVKLKNENAEKAEQLEFLKINNEKQVSEISKMRVDLEQSNSVRLLLTKELEDIKLNFRINELHNNLNFIGSESGSIITDESNRELICTPNQLSTQSLLDKHSPFKSYNVEQISRNDSGLAPSISNSPILKATDIEYCQTNFLNDRKNDKTVEEKFLQLKFDYKQMQTEHFQEALKVTEFPQELNDVKLEMIRLDESTSANEQIIIDYQNKFHHNKMEIEYPINDKAETKNNATIMFLQESNKKCKTKLTEVEMKLKAYEDDERRIGKNSENYREISVNLKKELLNVNSKLEQSLITCSKEHLTKIEKLEKELQKRTVTECDLIEKISEYEKDFIRLNTLCSKITEFENLLPRIKKKKSVLRRKLNEKLESLLSIEKQLGNLLYNIEQHDDQILLLKSDLNTTIRTNMSNSQRAKKLSIEVAKLADKISIMKEDIIQIEGSRIESNEDTNKEIENLRIKLTSFEENDAILNVIWDSNISKQDEIDKLKLSLSEKEKELDLLKQTRNATIQRYENLIQQLKNTLKLNNYTSKLEEMFSNKKKFLFCDLNEPCNIHESEPPICHWHSSLTRTQSDLLSSYRVKTLKRSTSAESYGKIVQNERSCQLMRGISENSLKMAKRAYKKMYSKSCKDMYLLNDFVTCLGLNILNKDRIAFKRLKTQRKIHRLPRKCYKHFN